MERKAILGPATLWGILVSQYEDPRRNEAYEVENGLLDACSLEAEVKEDPRDAESRGNSEESHRELGARPAVLSGILQSETSARTTNDEGLENQDRDLWLAAGFEIGQEDIAAIPAVTAAPDVNDDQLDQLPRGPYIIKSSPAKGQGIFASQDIVRGTRILTDKPFFTIAKPYNLGTIISEFERMSHARRKLYMQFSCPDRPDDKHMTDVARIFEANCFNIDHSAAVFQTATRFNHACLPNTYYWWNEARHEVVFQAMIDVKQDEELTIAYGYPFLSRRERDAELRIYNFKCACAACEPDTPFGQASEARRLVMKALDEQIVMCQTTLDDDARQDPLPAVLELIELVKEEGLWWELMRLYRDAAGLQRERGNAEEALALARLQLEQERVCMGEESDVVAKTRRSIAELEMELKGKGQSEC